MDKKATYRSPSAQAFTLCDHCHNYVDIDTAVITEKWLEDFDRYLILCERCAQIEYGGGE